MMKKRSLFTIIFLAIVFAACQGAKPAWGEGEFAIEIPSRTMLLEVHGHGPIAVIMANTMTGSLYSWSPLVQAADPERYTMVNFAYTKNDLSSTRRDVSELSTYLVGVGYEKIVCAGGSMGAYACGTVAKEPTTVGLVLLAGQEGADYAEVTVPKLFIAAEGDFKREMELQHQYAAEPKAIRIFPGAAHATALFATASEAELVSLILDFLAGIH
jgi:hypothetical protein